MNKVNFIKKIRDSNRVWWRGVTKWRLIGFGGGELFSKF